MTDRDDRGANTRSVVRRPVPVPSEFTRPFWDAAKNRQLVIQRCSKCGQFYHPPVPQCSKCSSTTFGWEPVLGSGTIYEATIMYLPRVGGFEAAVPYACILVELRDQPGILLLTNLIGAHPTEARIGAPVELDFEDIGGGYVLPQYRLARE